MSISFSPSKSEAIDVDIDEILDMDTDDSRISHLRVSSIVDVNFDTKK